MGGAMCVGARSLKGRKTAGSLEESQEMTISEKEMFTNSSSLEWNSGPQENGMKTDLSRDFTRGRMFMSRPREVSKEFYGIRPAIRGLGGLGSEEMEVFWERERGHFRTGAALDLRWLYVIIPRHGIIALAQTGVGCKWANSQLGLV